MSGHVRPNLAGHRLGRAILHSASNGPRSSNLGPARNLRGDLPVPGCSTAPPNCSLGPLGHRDHNGTRQRIHKPRSATICVSSRSYKQRTGPAHVGPRCQHRRFTAKGMRFTAWVRMAHMLRVQIPSRVLLPPLLQLGDHMAREWVFVVAAALVGFRMVACALAREGCSVLWMDTMDTMQPHLFQTRMGLCLPAQWPWGHGVVSPPPNPT